MLKKEAIGRAGEDNYLFTSEPLKHFTSPEYNLLEGSCMATCNIRTDNEACHKACDLEFSHFGAHCCSEGHFWR
jgi:hypothetical protein